MSNDHGDDSGRDRAAQIALLVMLLVVIFLFTVAAKGTGSGQVAAISHAQITLDQRFDGYDFSDCAQPG